jgi:hypothetical protein
MKIRISEIEQTFKEIFEEEEGRVSSVETVWELSKDKDYYKLVISIHNLSIEETLIIHTKFIFKCDLEKKFVTEESFIYLYDINCVYHKIDFDNVMDLKEKVEDIVISNDFGEDIQILSDFIEAPAMFLNYYMKRSKITDYSVFEVKYEPKFKTMPCDKTTFDFEININNNYRIFLSLSKRDKTDVEDYDTYIFQFRFLDEYETVENDTLQNIHFMIGSQIAKLLDKKLK